MDWRPAQGRNTNAIKAITASSFTDAGHSEGDRQEKGNVVADESNRIHDGTPPAEQQNDRADIFRQWKAGVT
jgi:hypothetical protein